MLEIGTPTGLHDSACEMISIGSYVKVPCEDEQGVHGAFAVYQVEARGAIPVLSYRFSEKGIVLPSGWSGCPLSDFYDTEQLVCGELDDLVPEEHLRTLPTWDAKKEYNIFLNAEKEAKKERGRLRRKALK
jgi:hypothetical protein